RHCDERKQREHAPPEELPGAGRGFRCTHRSLLPCLVRAVAAARRRRNQSPHRKPDNPLLMESLASGVSGLPPLLASFADSAFACASIFALSCFISRAATSL